MNDADVTALLAAGDLAAEPALAPDYVEQTLRRARRSVRTRRGVGALAALLVVAVIVLVQPWPTRWFQSVPPAGPDRVPTLPEEFAPFSRFTSHVNDRPAGRAIALYEYGSSELGTSWQTLVVGADRDTYRRAETEQDLAPPVLLSPDGTKLLYYKPSKGTDEFTLLDLTTMQTTVLHSVEWRSHVTGLTMLAWSPDGRYVAYSVPASPPADGKAESSFVDGDFITELAILDVINDSTVRYSQIGPVRGAAFAPDSERLVVQLPRDEAWIVAVRGEKLQQLTLTAGADLAGNAAWSPDGSLIATILQPPFRADGSLHSSDAKIRFVDATGTTRPVPADLPFGNVLGWRSPTSVLVQTPISATNDAIVEVSLADGRTTVLSRFSDRHVCEHGLQICHAYRIQLATGLLDQVRMRPSDPDRGPLAEVISALPGVQVGLAAAGLLWFILGRRGARRKDPVGP